MEENRSVLFTEKDGYLEVLFPDGFILNAESSKEMTPGILQKCKENNYTKILVLSGDTKRNLSPADTIEAGDRAIENKIQGFRIAVVRNDSEFNKDHQFTENVGINRGIFVKYFSEKGKALKWLLE